jgi:chorismate mutase / prephenate dehydratase
MVSNCSHNLQSIDRQLLKLLMDRVQFVRSQGPVTSSSHQHWPEVLEDYSQEQPALLLELLKHVDSLSNRLANSAESVAFLGPIYSFSYLAATKYFGMGAQLIPVNTISAAFEEVQRQQVRFAVVPVENNTDGRIVDTLGMFARSPVKICGEVLLPIHHCLLGIGQRSCIREVHSKPQALSQCRGWLATHLPNVRLVEVASTAEAAANASSSETIAAIASREAGIHHGCKILVENIEDNSSNVTRFAVIGERDCPVTGNDKTSLMFQLSHQPGSLADAMLVFKQAGVNLTWIESFPLPNRPNEYLFFVELEGHKDSPSVQAAIQNLQQHSVRLDLLGSYAKGCV